MAEESFSEWQQIQSPFSTTGKDQLNKYSDVVVTTEDLPNNNDPQLFQEPHNSAVSAAETTMLVPCSGDNNEKGQGKRWLKKHLTELTCRIVQIVCKAKNYAASKVGVGTFTSTTLFALLSVSLFYLIIHKWRRQRQIDTSNKFVLLIKEKDQKIEQLSLQISHMNDSLLARRKVPVLRVG